MIDASLAKLKKVPAVNSQELLIYLAGLDEGPILKIVTKSGFIYSGFALSVGDTRQDGAMLILQLIAQRNEITNGVLHIAVANIESIEMPQDDHTISNLSLGKFSAHAQYNISGKLDVLRGFKAFADNINNNFGLAIAAPEMLQLSTDGHVLGRILKLTQTIQQSFEEVFKEEDARNSWKASYNKIVFVNAAGFDVNGESGVMTINFPFDDVLLPEISQQELIVKILSVL
jgi:hypothetical protein